MKPHGQSFWLFSSLSLFWLAIISPRIQAQIVQDATLPNPSIVILNGNTSVIKGGTQAGSNLFHSFKDFSIPTDGVASFQEIDQGIENVISRVTGSSVSNINGLIEVLGSGVSTNFFLLNPNGIIFGPNAALNIGGSFVASTASSLNFTDGNQFSATVPPTTLLTVSVPIGLQFGQSPGSILNQSQVTDGSDVIVGLQVQPDKTLALVGGNVSLDSGYLLAPGGRVELGGVAESGTVGLNIDGNNLRLSFPPGVQRADISLSEAFVDVSGEGGGSIQMQGRRIWVSDGSQIGAFTLGSKLGGTLAVTASESVELSGTSADGQFSSGLFSSVDPEATGTGSNITVETGRLIVRDGAQIQAFTFGKGSGGNLAVTASESVELIGSTVNEPIRSGLLVTVEEGATGIGGNLTIETGQLIVRDGAQVTTSTFGQGPAGNLTVRAADSVKVSGRSQDRRIGSGLRATVQKGAIGSGGNLTIETGQLLVQDGAQVITSTFGQGQAGNLTVQDATVVELVGGNVAADNKFISSGLFTTAEPNSIGVGGNLTISTEKLIVRDGAQVNSTTLSVGRAGDLTVRATNVELIGAALSANGELVTNEIGLPFASGLFAGTGIGSGGDGGTLSVETTRLSLRDGANLQTTTFGAGDAGNLVIRATDSVELTGTAKGSLYPTSLVAVSGGIPELGGVVEAKGRGGDLTTETGELIVRDGAAVAVSSLNPATDALGAGNLKITAQSIRLDNLAKLQAATASGDGGNITLQVQDLLLLRRNSEISATAGIAGAGGNGGNINIDTSFIVGVPEEDSDITANAFKGAGGSIQVEATQVFGLERREQLTQLSDITAFSQQNPELNGIVRINTPDVDPSRGLVNLPAEVVDASRLIASGCGTPQRQQSEFIVTGRGGLPSSPSETLSSDTVWSDLRTQTHQAQNLTSFEQARQQTLPTTPQLVEAQGWVINNKGEVVLIASAPNVTPRSPGLTPLACQP